MTEIYFKKFLNNCWLILLLLVASYGFFVRFKSYSANHRDKTAPPGTYVNNMGLAAPAICNISEDETIGACDSTVLTVDTGVSGYTWYNGSTSSSVTVTETGMYWWQFLDMTRNTVRNGNFSAGNTGFTSAYTYKQAQKNALYDERTYTVTTDPSNVHDNSASFRDHTGGTNRRMMVVNGSLEDNTSVWSQEIEVSPNTSYIFSIWGASVHRDNPGRLTFSINGTQIGNINLSATTGQWSEFTTEWESGTSTTAQIGIVNVNTAAGGNDFALDDIVFAPVCRKNFDVTIYKSPPKPSIATE